MASKTRTYHIDLAYDAYYCKTMAVDAENVAKACEFATAHADDDATWEDSLESSTHWIVSVDDDYNLVPEEYGAAAIRCGGVGFIASQLRTGLRALVEACERDPDVLRTLDEDVQLAKAILAELPPWDCTESD